MIDNPYFGLATLTSISLLICLDRSAIGADLQDISHFFQLSSQQAGLLGTLYSVGQVLAGPTLGYLGDRCARKWILLVSLVAWNSSSLGVSLLEEHQHHFLLLARLLAGAGAAGFYSVANTCLADLFEPARRKLAFSLFYGVSLLGIGLGLLAGSLILSLGDWRWAFRLGPLSSLLILTCLLLMSEPKRGAADHCEPVPADSDSLLTSLNHLRHNRALLWTALGYTCFMFYELAYCLWLPSFFMFLHPTTAHLVPGLMGALVSLFGLAGVWLGAQLTRKLATTCDRANPLICSLATLSLASFMFMALSTAPHSTALGWLFFSASVLCGSVLLTPQSETLVDIVAPQKRAFADSLLQVLANSVGSATGPTVVGLIKDRLEQSAHFDEQQAFYLALMAPLCAPLLGSGAFWRASKHYVAACEVARQSAAAKEQPSQPPSDRKHVITF